jgi:hypothetical protein
MFVEVVCVVEFVTTFILAVVIARITQPLSHFSHEPQLKCIWIVPADSTQLLSCSLANVDRLLADNIVSLIMHGCRRPVTSDRPGLRQLGEMSSCASTHMWQAKQQDSSAKQCLSLLSGLREAVIGWWL